MAPDPLRLGNRLDEPAREHAGAEVPLVDGPPEHRLVHALELADRVKRAGTSSNPASRVGIDEAVLERGDARDR